MKSFTVLSSFADRSIKVMGSSIKASKKEILLGVRVDNDLTFKKRVSALKLIKNFMY